MTIFGRGMVKNVGFPFREFVKNNWYLVYIIEFTLGRGKETPTILHLLRVFFCFVYNFLFQDEAFGGLSVCAKDESERTIARRKVLRLYTGNKAGTSAVQIASYNMAKSFRELPLNTLELWLGNYLEFVAVGIVGVELSGSYLYHTSMCIP